MKKIIASLIFAAGCCIPSGTQDADLGRVLDVTVKTLTQFETTPQSPDNESAMADFSASLQTAFNQSNPQIHPGPIGAALRDDGSILGFHDKNANNAQEQDEPNLFTVEIDEENQRLIATDMNQRSTEHRFRPGGFLTGFFIANMITRQRAAGISRSSFNSRNVAPRSAYKSARTRAGSGSHSAGK